MGCDGFYVLWALAMPFTKQKVLSLIIVILFFCLCVCVCVWVFLHCMIVLTSCFHQDDMMGALFFFIPFYLSKVAFFDFLFLGFVWC